jgi:hypothetical protein
MLRYVSWLRIMNLAVAILAVVAPVAHVLELPNKLSLDADLWLAVQEHLYRGWGPLVGAPTEMGGLVTSAVLAWVRRRQRFALNMTLIACVGYAGMLASFFVLNSPVNFAVSSWTPTMMPPDWPEYRLRWELGHATACLLSVVSLTSLFTAYRSEAPS